MTQKQEQEWIIELPDHRRPGVWDEIKLEDQIKTLVTIAAGAKAKKQIEKVFEEYRLQVPAIGPAKNSLVKSVQRALKDERNRELAEKLGLKFRRNEKAEQPKPEGGE